MPDYIGPNEVAAYRQIFPLMQQQFVLATEGASQRVYHAQRPYSQSIRRHQQHLRSASSVTEGKRMLHNALGLSMQGCTYEAGRPIACWQAIIRIW